MPSLNLTIEDNSPVLVYSKNWRAGTSNGDNMADSYSQSSFMVSDANGDSVSFAFNGTGVQIYGAKRANHGTYQVTLDAPGSPQVSYNENGTQDGNLSSFGVSLVPSLSSFPQGEHTLTLINTGNAQYLDVDFLSWQTNIGLPSEQIIVSTFQDTDPSFTYVPADAWSTGPKNVGLFEGGSGHTTSTIGASLTFTFQARDAVALYGPVDPNGAEYAAQIDGGVIANYTTNRKYYRPQLMMYQASNLGPGTHDLKLFYGSGNSGGENLAIDYVTVFTTPSLKTLEVGSNSSSRHGAQAGRIVGIVGGTIATFLIAALIYYYYFIYRPKRQLNKLVLDEEHGPEQTFVGVLSSSARVSRIHPFLSQQSTLHSPSRKLPNVDQGSQSIVRSPSSGTAAGRIPPPEYAVAETSQLLEAPVT